MNSIQDLVIAINKESGQIRDLLQYESVQDFHELAGLYGDDCDVKLVKLDLSGKANKLIEMLRVIAATTDWLEADAVMTDLIKAVYNGIQQS
jgi:hypothetical protein